MAYDSTLGRLPDPATNPAGPGFVSLTIHNDSPGMMQRLNDGSTISIRFGGDAWEFNIGFPELTIVEAKAIQPFLMSHGPFETFYIQIPTAIEPASGAWDVSTILLRAEGSLTMGATAFEVNIPAYSTRGGTLEAGDYLKFTNINKIYLITATELNADVLTMTLHSEIQDTVAIITAGLEPNDIRFRVRQEKTPNFSLNTEGLYAAFTIKLRENIR